MLDRGAHSGLRPFTCIFFIRWLLWNVAFRLRTLAQSVCQHSGLNLGHGIFPVNFRIKWLLWDLDVCVNVWNIWRDVKLLHVGFFLVPSSWRVFVSTLCTGPRLHSSVRGQRSYWCLGRICSLINCTYLHPVSKMGRGSTQEPPCRQFAIFIFSALLSQSVLSTIYSRLTELHQNTLILRART